MDQNPGLDPSKLIWVGLIVLLVFGLGIVALTPPELPKEDQPTPGPSPEVSSIQCLDGQVFRSIDEIVVQPTDGGFPTKGRWTLTFADGGYVLDQSGVHEAGKYRCDGGLVLAKGVLGSHRAQRDAATGRLAWDGQGFELTDGGASTPFPPESPAPKSVTTSG